MARTSSPGLSRGAHQAARVATFEETYPRHEYAELVRLGLAFAGWLAKRYRRAETRRLNASPGPLPGGMSPAD